MSLQTVSALPLAATTTREWAMKTTLALPDVVHRLKSFTTTLYRRGVQEKGWAAFPSRFWQRNYYEHIVRNDEELNRIRAYIEMNPARWAWDLQNAEAIPGWKPEAPWQV